MEYLLDSKETELKQSKHLLSIYDVTGIVKPLSEWVILGLVVPKLWCPQASSISRTWNCYKCKFFVPTPELLNQKEGLRNLPVSKPSR